jgi:hypothetical protein
VTTRQYVSGQSFVVILGTTKININYISEEDDLAEETAKMTEFERFEQKGKPCIGVSVQRVNEIGVSIHIYNKSSFLK